MIVILVLVLVLAIGAVAFFFIETMSQKEEFDELQKKYVVAASEEKTSSPLFENQKDSQSGTNSDPDYSSNSKEPGDVA